MCAWRRLYESTAARHGQLVTVVTARVMALLINGGDCSQGAGSVTPVSVSMTSHIYVRNVLAPGGLGGESISAKAWIRL